MIYSGFTKLYWGFFFLMISFRIQGFDIFPDVIGFILFILAFHELASYSSYFTKAGKLCIPMIFLSILYIYQVPTQNSGINFEPFGAFGIPLTILSIILNLYIVYNLFLGVIEMANSRELPFLANEAMNKWKDYLLLQVAMLFAFVVVFIPGLGLAYIFVLLVLSIGLAIRIMGFMKKCRESLGEAGDGDEPNNPADPEEIVETNENNYTEE